MSSLKSRLVIFAVQHSHLLKGKLKREVVDEHTSIPNLRAQFEAGAQKFGGIPAGVTVSPVTIPELPKGLSAEWIHPAGSANSPCAADRAIFYTHGGGYISGNCIDHRNHVAKFVKSSGIGALLYDYRLAPEHPFPAAMDDTLAAYRWLTAQGVEPQKTIIVGESAGGGLCLASLLAIRDTGLPLPAAGVALSPWVDLHQRLVPHERLPGYFHPRVVADLEPLLLRRQRPKDPVDFSALRRPARAAAHDDCGRRPRNYAGRRLQVCRKSQRSRCGNDPEGVGGHGALLPHVRPGVQGSHRSLG